MYDIYFLLHAVDANWSAGACTTAFPEYDVDSHLFYGAVIVASVVWLTPTKSSGYVLYQQLKKIASCLMIHKYCLVGLAQDCGILHVHYE